LGGNLNLKCKTRRELINSIDNLAISIDDKIVTGFAIDLLFRTLSVTLENSSNLLNKEVNSIRNNVSFFIKVHDIEVMIEKYAINFS
jgi:hypothetical protein